MLTDSSFVISIKTIPKYT